jgi:hypothetical protein
VRKMSSDRITEFGAVPHDCPKLTDSRGRVLVSRHADHRWNERKPHGCTVELSDAWDAGERLKHSDVARNETYDSVPESRIYWHGRDWAVVFLINESHEVRRWANTERILMTVRRFRDFDHGPTRAYLSGYGPHDR